MIKQEKRLVTDYLIAGVILSSFAMLFLSFYVDIQIATYCLFLNLILSIGGCIMLIPSGHKYLRWAAALIVLALLRNILFWGTIKFVDTLIFISIICFATVVSIRPLIAMNCNLLYWGAVVCALQLILNAHDPQYYSLEQWLVYVYMNSNTAAAVALNLLACIVTGTFRYRKRIMWVFSTALAAYLLYIIYQTHSRAAFVSGLLMVGLVAWSHFKPLKETLAQWMLWMPVIAIPIVVLVFQKTFHADVTFLDKTVFSGREDLWADALQVIWSNLIHMENQFTSGLNTALRLPYLCGIVGAVLYFLYYRRLAKDLCQNTMNAGRLNPAILVLGTLFIQQSFESTIVSGTYCIAYISMCMLGMAAWLGEKK